MNIWTNHIESILMITYTSWHLLILSAPVWPYNRTNGLPGFYIIVDGAARLILVPGSLLLFADASTSYFCNSLLS
jgi:hypothetical protein